MCRQPQLEVTGRGDSARHAYPPLPGPWGCSVSAHLFLLQERNKRTRVDTSPQICVHIRMHTHMSTHRHTQTHTHLHTCMCPYVHAHVNTCALTHIPTHPHLCTYTHVCTHTQAYVHAYLSCLPADTCYKSFLTNVRFKLMDFSSLVVVVQSLSRV